MSRLLIPAVTAALVACAAPSWAQAPNVVTRESTVSATVERIERSIRVVTLRSEGNVQQSVYVDPAVTAFDDLKVGDEVTVRVVESAVVQVRPNAKLSDVHDTTEAARKAGQASVVEQQTAVVTIESVDPQGLSVTYRTKDGRKMARPVPDKRLLEGIRAGDRVEVTLTRERAISIERRRR